MRISKIIFYIVCSMFVIRIISVHVYMQTRVWRHSDIIHPKWGGYALWIISTSNEVDIGYYPPSNGATWLVRFVCLCDNNYILLKLHTHVVKIWNTNIFTWEIAYVNHIWNIENVKFPHVQFHTWKSHAEFHMRQITCKKSHAPFHMWNFTCE